MYSLIIMTAMAGSGDTTSFNGRLLNWFGGCHGCQGTTVVAGCYGSSCHGTFCQGSSCNGCGGGVFGVRMMRLSCHGCVGSSCMGSSCHGCHGAVITSAVWGASCHGSSCMGSCHGCMGSAPHGVMYYEGEVISMPSTGTVKLEPDDKDDQAKIQIEMPKNAKLYVDGTLVNSENGQFHTPKLVKGKSYFYDMKVEMMVEGKLVTETKQVAVRAGQTTVETFGGAKLASK